jgi:hypothetical protein
MFKKLSNIGTFMKPALVSVAKNLDVVSSPVKRYCRSILFALFLEVVGTCPPARKWLALVMYPSLQIASKVKWAITGYALYQLFFHGIHLPLWLSAASVFTSVLLVIALAAAKMESQHHGYLTS